MYGECLNGVQIWDAHSLKAGLTNRSRWIRLSGKFKLHLHKAHLSQYLGFFNEVTWPCRDNIYHISLFGNYLPSDPKPNKSMHTPSDVRNGWECVHGRAQSWRQTIMFGRPSSLTRIPQGEGRAQAKAGVNGRAGGSKGSALRTAKWRRAESPRMQSFGTSMYSL